MECNRFNSVAALMDVLVRSAHARGSRVSFPEPPIRAPVSSKPLTDFSICSILGLANDLTQSSSGPGELNSYISLSKLAFSSMLLNG